MEGSNIPSPRPRGYTGALNTAVLKAVLRADEGLLWENLHQSLEDVWAGRKMNENKGNTVMFVCDVADVCSAALDELSAAAPKDATLVLTPADAAEGKGALQAKLAAFLSEQPRGVVVIANIGRFPLETIPVLSNAMGEGGGFQMDGVNVSATDATYLLTFEVAPAIMASDGAANLSVAAKAELDVALTAADAASVDGESRLPCRLPFLSFACMSAIYAYLRIANTFISYCRGQERHCPVLPAPY